MGITVQDCPECEVGKHDNCDDRTWNHLTDAYTICPCSENGHDRSKA